MNSTARSNGQVTHTRNDVLSLVKLRLRSFGAFIQDGCAHGLNFTVFFHPLISSIALTVISDSINLLVKPIIKKC